MPRLAIKLVPVNALRLHDDVPIQDFSFRAPFRMGSELLIPGYIIMDRATDRVVAGIVPLKSAQAAFAGGETSVKVVCLFIEDVPAIFATTWPKLEAAASQLSKRESQILLLELLKSEAACVRLDNGRRVAEDLGISLRQLKRMRKRAREQKLLAPDAIAKKRKTKSKNVLPDAPTETTDASRAIETIAAVSSAPASPQAHASVVAPPRDIAAPTTGVPSSDGATESAGPANDGGIKTALPAPTSTSLIPTDKVIRAGGHANGALPRSIVNDGSAERWTSAMSETTGACGYPSPSNMDIVEAPDAPSASDKTGERGDDVSTGERSAAPPVVDGDTLPPPASD